MSLQNPLDYAPGGETAFSSPPPDLAAAPVTDAVSDPERIQGIDVARGLAIFGIFVVNMQLFAEPFGRMVGLPGPPPGASAADALAYYFMLIFCGGKFYPLFSLLFGIGFMIQLDRASRSGRQFVPAYVRRLAFLCVLGLAHGLLLWYGDILFIYSIAGSLLFGTVMIFRDISGRALIWTGITVILISALATTAINAAMGAAAPTETASADVSDAGGDDSAGAPATAPATLPATAPATVPGGEESPSGRLFAGFRDGTIEEGPADPLWMETETEAYRDGPYIEALTFRAMTWGFMILFTIFAGFGMHVLGMFFLGAGLYRAGIFSPGNLGIHRRFLLLGLLAGLPIVLLGIFLPRLTGNDAFYLLMSLTNMLGGPMMSLAYLGGATLVAASGVMKPAVAAVARVGRMALTNYLSETILATFLMYHWGLGWFGSVPPAQQMLIVACIYAGLLVTSTIWLRFFQFGPMEWLWRTVTYLRPQPLLRRSA